jgi:enoyl-CoA hydratase
MYDNYQTLLFRRDGAILTITMNRPEVRNAADMVMHNELSRVFREVARDDDTRVVILTGAGAAFSAGGDIIAMQRKLADRTLWIQTVIEAREIFYSMLDLDKPIIARVNGHASGLGATLAVYADIVVAVEEAKFADPHVKVGLTAGDGGALMWPMLIGFQKAKEYLLLGDQLTAREAERLGLINYCVPAAELDAKVNALASRLANGASRAIGWTKQAINMTLRQMALSSMEAGLGLETLSQMSADHAEAVAAFAEKREPHFAGR